MRGFLYAGIFALLGAMMACITSEAYAARSSQKPQKSASDIKTEFFSINLPAGWIMPQPVKKQPRDSGISVAFVSEADGLAVTITIIRAAADPKDLSAEIAKNMSESGLNASSPEQASGNMWRMKIRGKAQGEAWIGSSDGLSSITLILGKDLKPANALLARIKSAPAGLLPQSIN